MYAMNIVTFEEANFLASRKESSLKRTNFIGAEFIAADLKESDFRGVNLRESQLFPF